MEFAASIRIESEFGRAKSGGTVRSIRVVVVPHGRAENFMPTRNNAWNSYRANLDFANREGCRASWQLPKGFIGPIKDAHAF